MQRGPYLCEVRVNGRTIREYPHDNEIWIEGRKGSDFTLRISNQSDRRVMVPLSLDGLCAITGKEAGYENGYILPAYGHYDIPGWRLNNNEVAKFRFHKSGHSYAAQSGKPRNIGIIGCAFFPEKPVMIQPDVCVMDSSFEPEVTERGATRPRSVGPPVACSDDDYPTNAAPQPESRGMLRGMQPRCARRAVKTVKTSALQPSLGTEFGQRTEHRVRQTPFVKESDTPVARFEIRYADREELKGRGVPLDQRPSVGRPDPFPKIAQGCEPPEGWRG